MIFLCVGLGLLGGDYNWLGWALLASCRAQTSPPATTPFDTPTATPAAIPPGTPLILSDASQVAPRDQYRPFDFDRDPWLAGYVQEYQEALQAQAAWLEDPIAVALRLVGFPNPDETAPDQVSVFYQDPATTIVVVLQDPIVGDDSVAASEHRIELVKTGAIWEVTWAGGRYRCQPGRGQQDWQPDLCA